MCRRNKIKCYSHTEVKNGTTLITKIAMFFIGHQTENTERRDQTQRGYKEMKSDERN
jgi:hypothetical protein